MRDEKIAVLVNGEKRYVPKGIALSEIINGEKPCGGHGKCGKCKVLARGCLSDICDTEKSFLTEEEISSGVRLGCLTYALGECEIEKYERAAIARIMTDGVLPKIKLTPAFSRYGVAVDVGTTTLAARLYDTEGNMLSEASGLNPQSELGADVISRIEAALDGGASALALSVREAVDRILVELAKTAKINANDIDEAVITGNTVMLSLLTKTDVEPLSHAPFNAERLFGEFVFASELGLLSLEADTPVYLAPCISAFVGADTVCAVIATDHSHDECSLLVDIGTNGEMALRHKGKLTVCSTAAGPAFEGVGISQGMRASVGAIDKVNVLDGEFSVRVIGNTEPVGICGSGLVDAVACMLEEGVLDESGNLESDSYPLCEKVRITQKDVRMLQLAKSAIYAGIIALMKSVDTKPFDVSTLYVAGGFGNYLDKNNAVTIGLLPSELSDSSKNVGNAALSGASMLLLDSKLKKNAELVAQKATVLDLSVNQTFSEYFISGMSFEGLP